MSLPAPNLDDRTFEEIKNDALRQIALRCPEWTEHNPSDPGVTLVELFAWMTEMTLFRLNQVPEKNYIKFLDMLGVTLEPPTPARTDLRFLLSRPIEDQDGEEAFERTLRAQETVAATVRTESDPAIEFTTDENLHMARPRLAHVLALPALVQDLDIRKELPEARHFPNEEPTFPLYGPVPQEGDALYLGFETNISSNIVELRVDSVQSAATGLDEDYPAQKWEVWDGSENEWRSLDVPRDTTLGFNRPPGKQINGQATGQIELVMPAGLTVRQVDGHSAYWVRCRYALDLPARGVEQRRPAAYQKPPEIKSIQARVIGGVAPASNCATVLYKDLGQSDGRAGQLFPLGHAPVLTLRRGETVLVGMQGVPVAEREIWTLVADFSESGPEDRHFQCDTFAGEIRFGPAVLQPDGTVRQHGAIPSKGMTITFTAYRFGGGTRGNIAAGQVGILKSSIPYIASVTNATRAEGGRNLETLERAKLRGQAMLRQRDRAVTAEDFVYLAEQATSGVGRAYCVQPTALHDMGPNGERIPPGVVRVLLIPSLGDAVTVPRPADLRVPERVRRDVEDYLDERRLLTTIVEVDEPDYVYISTDISLIADPRADPDQVAQAVKTRLETYLHPLRGGPNGNGWPFRRRLTLADIYAQVQAARDVAFLLEAKLYVSRIANREEGRLTQEQAVSLADGIRLGSTELPCTRQHRVRAQSMEAIGRDSSALY